MDIIKKEFYSHPEEQLTDIVKLLFQRRFGPEHMIKDPLASLEYLKKELEDTDFDENMPLCDDIGGDFARINLAAVKGRLLPETVNRIFVLSANTDNRNDRKEEFLSDLKKLKGLDFLPFSQKETSDFIAEYSSLGFPPLSHSEIYRKKYAPHYRIARKKYTAWLPLFIEIEKTLSDKGKAIIGIDGMAASGKTTLAGIIAEIYDCNVFHADDYFLRPFQRTPERLLQAGGNIDYERMKSEITDCVFSEEPFEIRKYDCETQSLSETITVPKKPLTVIEGVYSLHPYFGNVYDIKLMLEISRDEQLLRLKKRDPSKLDRFINEWLPMEEKYFETYRIKEKSTF